MKLIVGYVVMSEQCKFGPSDTLELRGIKRSLFLRQPLLFGNFSPQCSFLGDDVSSYGDLCVECSSVQGNAEGGLIRSLISKHSNLAVCWWRLAEMPNIICIHISG